MQLDRHETPPEVAAKTEAPPDRNTGGDVGPISLAWADRLEALLLRRYTSAEFRREMRQIRTEGGGAEPHERLQLLLLLGACTIIQHTNGTRVDAMRRALEEPEADPALEQRIQRAARLLRRLVAAHVRARRERLQSAMLARLDHLLNLDRHDGDIYQNWQFNLNDGGQTISVRLGCRVMVAGFSPILKRMTNEEMEALESLSQSETIREKGLLGEYLDGHGRRAFQARRNERLLNRLLIRGISRHEGGAS